ncbi:MAG: RHS repeat domain-containing protein, partial [Planctomycetaceae bacterium]
MAALSPLNLAKNPPSEIRLIENAEKKLRVNVMVTTTKYVWDPVFDCVTHELDENNAVKAVYHNEPQQYGGVLSQRRGNTSHYHHHDALGSTRFLTDSSGNVTDTYLNDAWGNSVASTGTTVNPFKWVGRYGYYTDSSTGQVYVRARMYQPVLARWMSVDPLWISAFRQHYVYSRAMPCKWLDPSGLICTDDVCGPDVTGWFIDALRLIRTEVEKLTFGSDPYKQFWRTLQFDADVDGPSLRINGCPSSKDCLNTVGFCGICINVSELGNLALGDSSRRAKLPKIGIPLPLGAGGGAIALWGGFYGEVGDPKAARGFNKIEEIASVLAGLLLPDLPPRGSDPIEFCKSLKSPRHFNSQWLDDLIQGVLDFDRTASPL